MWEPLLSSSSTAILVQVARECQALTDACEFLVADRCGAVWGGSCLALPHVKCTATLALTSIPLTRPFP